MMDTVLNLGMTDAVQEALGEIGGAEYAADTRRRFIEQFTKVVGAEPPDDRGQLRAAIAAVFDSWQSERAVAYRAEREISGHGGTAVTVQAMVFGNLDDASGKPGGCSPGTDRGDEEHYGEWLPRGQGEDVVSGAFDPLPLEAMADRSPMRMSSCSPSRRLDASAGVAQDIEFTVERGKLWLLQCRRAKVLQAAGPQRR